MRPSGPPGLGCLDPRCCDVDKYDNHDSDSVNSVSDNDKCWCNKDDCRMYLETDFASDYYQQNSDIIYGNINGNVNSEHRTLGMRDEAGEGVEITDTDSDTASSSSASDATMTSLDSGIRTVIYESASSKGAGSLPKDEEDVNKNISPKSHTKSTCVVS